MSKSAEEAGPRDRFGCISPVDYRYYNPEIANYLSEDAFTRCKLAMEQALVTALHRRNVCSEAVLKEIAAACQNVTTEEVYAEEDRIGHDIRALVNCIRAKVSDEAKPFVHMTATSYDIVDSANAMRWSGAVRQVLIPALKVLEYVLIDITVCEAETLQIGRTHGQHAVPITFGFAMSGFVSRLGESIETLDVLAANLPGKFSGAVGAYNASSLFVDDPEEFERAVLAIAGLISAEHSTQITPPERFTRMFNEITVACGIMANLADNMRHLQRTEIGEAGEEFGADQVGSSTMPQKRNPIGFENVKSLWKALMPHMVTMYMDQISEHERDLTNSASSRTYSEVIAYAYEMTRRLTRVINKLRVDKQNLAKNLGLQQGLALAEPLYLILASLGHPDAHEKVRTLTLLAQRERRPLSEVAALDEELEPYRSRMTKRQWEIFHDPSKYTGIASKKALAIAERWKKRFRV